MSCTLCPLHKTALSVCIPGRGAAEAPVPFLIVAQNPGAQEDYEGRVLAGPTGKLLRQMLLDAGYDLSQVRVTNAVRCRTPDNRAPATEEIKACQTHLIEEIKTYAPRVIVALGDVALKTLCGNVTIKEARGRSLPLHKSMQHTGECWTTYHPAYVLRSPMARNVVVSDLAKFRGQSDPEQEIPWTWYKPSNDTVALDVETDYDYEKKTGGENIIQVAVCSSDSDVCVSKEQWKDLALSVSASKIVGHNSWAFDIPRLRASGIPVPWGEDTLVLATLDDETQPLSLEALCAKYLRIKGWKDEGHRADRGSDDFALYNARDALYTRQLYFKLVKALGTSKRGIPRTALADLIILPGKLALDECSRRGNLIDQRAVSAARQKYEKILATHKNELHEITEDYELNLNSYPQIAQVIIKLGGNLGKSEKGNYVVDKAVIQLISCNTGKCGEFAKRLLVYRNARDKLKFVSIYEKAADAHDSRVHPTYYAYKGVGYEKANEETGGTVVGRTSCKNPNVQNNDREFKNFLSVPPGKCFVAADYAAIHIRLFADAAEEQELKRRYAADIAWAPHKFFASILYGKREEDVTTEGAQSEKQIAKSANFSLLYMGDEHTLQNYCQKMGIMISLNECARIKMLWHQTFPAARIFYEQVRKEMKEFGYVETPTGRRRHFGDLSLLNKSGFMAAWREAVNFKVLGFEPDIALRGLAECHAEGLPINLFVHDSIGFEFENEAEARSKEGLIAHCMTERPVQFLEEKFNYKLSVPLYVEFEYKNARM